MPANPFALVRSCLIGLSLLSASIAAAVEPPRVIDSYVLFALDEMIIKGASDTGERGHIRGGDIGVNNPTSTVGTFALSYATSGRVIMEPGSNAVADSIRADNPEGIIYNLFANRVNATFRPTILTSGPTPFTPPILAPADVPALLFTPGRALTDNASNVTVGGTGLPSPFTFTPGAYRDVRVNANSVVNFGDGVFDLRSLSVGKDVTINVTNDTVLQIDRGVAINDGLKLGLGTTSNARIYVGGFGFNPDSIPVTNFAHNAEIHVQFFAPTSWVDIGGRNQLFGRYIAKRITGDPNNNVTLEFPPLQPPGGVDPKRFHCYEIHRRKLDRAGVTLVDVLGSSTVTIQKAKRICAPANVNGQDPTAPSDPGHLTYYTIDQTTPFKKVKGIDVTTAFGTVTVKLSVPDRLLVPTAKSLAGPLPPLATPIDHFKCYRITGAKFRADDLSVNDQFGTITVDVKRPLHLCLAASKNGEPVVNPAAAMMCYSIRGARAKTAPKLIYTNNPFGPDQYPFFGPRDLCYPATIALP